MLPQLLNGTILLLEWTKDAYEGVKCKVLRGKFSVACWGNVVSMANMTGCDEWCYTKRGRARYVHALNVCPRWAGELNGSKQRKAPFYDRISPPFLCQDLSFRNITLIAGMAIGYTALTRFDTRVTQWNRFINRREWHRFPPNQTLRDSLLLMK